MGISLVFDEGSDNDPNGSPEIVLDNILLAAGLPASRKQFYQAGPALLAVALARARF